MIGYDKTKIGDYVSDKPLKKPGGEELDNINTAASRTCDTSSEHEKRKRTTANMLENMEVPNIVQMEKETNQDTIKHLPWDGFLGNGLGLPYQCGNISKATTITYDTSTDHENVVKTITYRYEEEPSNNFSWKGRQHRIHSY